MFTKCAIPENRANRIIGTETFRLPLVVQQRDGRAIAASAVVGADGLEPPTLSV
jgi:hypothetical protein